MKAVILAGGLGTRISEETALRPKPMIEIGGRPILWHIMKIYAAHGVTDFIVCLGYKGYMIKEYFANYCLHRSDVTIDLRARQRRRTTRAAEPWKVTLVDTGEDTHDRRPAQAREQYLTPNEPFCLTYGDGVADLDIGAEIAVPQAATARTATIAAVRAAGRYGALELDGDAVASFTEKPPGDNGLINGGFFVCTRASSIASTATTRVWETEPTGGPGRTMANDGLPPLAASGSRWIRCATRTAGSAVGERQGALESLVSTRSSTDDASGSGLTTSFANPPSPSRAACRTPSPASLDQCTAIHKPLGWPAPSRASTSATPWY